MGVGEHVCEFTGSGRARDVGANVRVFAGAIVECDKRTGARVVFEVSTASRMCGGRAVVAWFYNRRINYDFGVFSLLDVGGLSTDRPTDRPSRQRNCNNNSKRLSGPSSIGSKKGIGFVCVCVCAPKEIRQTYPRHGCGMGFIWCDTCGSHYYTLICCAKSRCFFCGLLARPTQFV